MNWRIVLVTLCGLVFSQGLGANSAHAASCGDWLDHTVMAHPSHEFVYQGLPSQRFQESLPPIPPRTCEGPSCGKAPAVPPIPPLPARVVASIKDACGPLGDQNALPAPWWRLSLLVEQLRPQRGFPPRIDRPPRV